MTNISVHTLQGVICTGLAYYVGAMVTQSKGPVFFAVFNPLTMLTVAVMSSFVFKETMYLGRYIRAIRCFIEFGYSHQLLSFKKKIFKINKKKVYLV